MEQRSRALPVDYKPQTFPGGESAKFSKPVITAAPFTAQLCAPGRFGGFVFLSRKLWPASAAPIALVASMYAFNTPPVPAAAATAGSAREYKWPVGKFTAAPEYYKVEHWPLVHRLQVIQLDVHFVVAPLFSGLFCRLIDWCFHF